MNRVVRAAVLMLCLICAVPEARASITFLDASFNDADWTATKHTDANGTGTATGANTATGGNPGAYRQVPISVQPTFVGSVFSTVIGYHEKTAAVYNPASQGAISSIDFSQDALNLSGTQAIGAAVRQGGIIYAGPSLVTAGSIWASYAQPGLLASQFNDLDHFQSGGLHPDFSASGAPITFGFFDAVSARFNTTTSVGIDNWSLTVNQVPEPGSLAALWLGVLLLKFRRVRTAGHLTA